jgi:hypothetical protein
MTTFFGDFQSLVFWALEVAACFFWQIDARMKTGLSAQLSRKTALIADQGKSRMCEQLRDKRKSTFKKSRIL